MLRFTYIVCDHRVSCVGIIRQACLPVSLCPSRTSKALNRASRCNRLLVFYTVLVCVCVCARLVAAAQAFLGHVVPTIKGLKDCRVQWVLYGLPVDRQGDGVSSPRAMISCCIQKMIRNRVGVFSRKRNSLGKSKNIQKSKVTEN